MKDNGNLSVRSAKEQLEAIHGAKDFLRGNQQETPDKFGYYQKQINKLCQEEGELNSWLKANGGFGNRGIFEDDDSVEWDEAAQEELSHFNDDLYGDTANNYKPVIDISEAALYNQNKSTPYNNSEIIRKIYEDWYSDEDGLKPKLEYFIDQNPALLSGQIYTDPDSGQSYHIAPDGTMSLMDELTEPMPEDKNLGTGSNSDLNSFSTGGFKAINSLPSGGKFDLANGKSYFDNSGRFVPSNIKNAEAGTAIKTPTVTVSPAVSKYSDELGEDNSDRVPTWDETVQAWKDLTKQGDLDGFLSVALGTYKDKKGIYHISQNSWQKYFGYNETYDDVFRASTSMNSKKFTFEIDGQEYMIWAWKGDYINLGAGAELGIYTRSKFDKESGENLDHWPADPSLAMPMTMTLYYNGEPIITYDPNSDDPDDQSKKKWWMNSFDPQHQGVKEGELTATYTIDFTDKPQLYIAFYEKHGNDTRWAFDENTHITTFTFQ